MSLRKRMSGLALEFSRKAIWGFDGFCARYSKVGDREVFDHRDFPWLPAIEADWRKVRAELDAILPYMAHMQNFHDVLPNYLTQGEGWKTYFLYGFGLKAPKNCRRCPETVKLLKRIPGMKTAFFSILGPPLTGRKRDDQVAMVGGAHVRQDHQAAIPIVREGRDGSLDLTDVADGAGASGTS